MDAATKAAAEKGASCIAFLDSTSIWKVLASLCILPITRVTGFHVETVQMSSSSDVDEPKILREIKCFSA